VARPRAAGRRHRGEPQPPRERSSHTPRSRTCCTSEAILGCAAHTKAERISNHQACACALS
jgi:hypothetical protein